MIKVTDVSNFLGITNTKESEPEPPKNPMFDLEKEGEKKILYEWTAPGRTVKKMLNQRSLRSMIVIFSVVALLLIIMQEFLLILVVASIFFISYVLSATPADTVKYEISNHGVSYNSQFYYWNALKQFFFTKQGDFDVLNVDITNALPGRLFLTVKEGDKEKLQEMFSRYLPFLEEEPKTILDKAYNSVMNKFDLDGK